MDDPEPNFKHYCRVCKKGFMCGRALGGHMRAHGIGDETGSGGYVDDDDPGSDWEEKGTEKSHSKRIYQLRTNPNRLKSCRNCENCGKEFLSWKSFLEHGKCSSDDASESLVSSPDSYGDEEDGGGMGRRGGGWSKRKRSLRSKVGSGEDDDLLLARCLVQLANTVVDPPSAAEPEESCASASREEDQRRNAASGYYYSSVPQQQGTMIRDRAAAAYDYKAKGVSSPGKGVFECKACKKVFNSHQALGGHRASHKKVKGCFAAKQDITEDQQNNHNHNSSSPAAIIAEDEVIINDEFLTAKPSPSPAPAPSSYGYENTPVLVGSARRKSKVHECSICHRIFPSGQALGGHKRCHWITSNSPETSSIPKFNFPENTTAAANANANSTVTEKLDLNVPAWAHVSGVRRDPNNPLSFEVSTDMHLQIPSCRPLNAQENNSNNNKNGDVDEKGVDVEKNGPTPNGVDDEAASELKLSRLSDLNDLKYSSNSSQWLQVGIGSTTQATAPDL